MVDANDFNLVRDPWLPITTIDGQSEEWSIREFFHRSHQAIGFNEPSPLAYTVILRFLLAVGHRALMGPKTDYDWMKLWDRRALGFDTKQIDTYLDTWEHRFNLFDTDAPFAQVTDFAETVSGSPLSRLILENTSGSNSTLFDHSRDDVTPSFSASAAARALLSAHQYAFAGTAGRYMQAPLVAGYAVSWEGTTLYETLVLNMVLYGAGSPPMLGTENDLPFWEDSELRLPNKEVRQARGLTDLYTFRGRRLQLIPEPDGSVQRVRYEQGLVLDLLNENFRDPFKRYLAQKTAGAQLPRNFGENRALWRDADGLLERVLDMGAENDPPTVIIDLEDRLEDFQGELVGLVPNLVATGLVNNQARISLWRMDRMAMPLAIISNEERLDSLNQAIALAETAWSDALRPASRIYASVGLTGDPKGGDSKDIASIVSRISIEQRYWSQLDRLFQAFLAELGASPNPLVPLEAWRMNLRRLCEDVFASAAGTLTGKMWYQAQSAGGIHLAGRLNRVGFAIEEVEVGI